jgi:hypothetical protein
VVWLCHPSSIGNADAESTSIIVLSGSQSQHDLSKPSDILVEDVIAAAGDYREHPSAFTAFTAVGRVFHFIDRIVEYCDENNLISSVLGGQNLRAFRDHLIRTEPDIRLADRVTNAGKHHRIERDTFTYTSTGLFYNDKGVFWIRDAHGQKERAVDEFLTSAIATWRRWLQAHPEL